MKKLKWSSLQLEAYLDRPGVCHDFYPTEKPLYKLLESFYKHYLKKS